jgi:membrane-bound metal-dependent hydrolase YbcI (DUF457 family)
MLGYTHAVVGLTTLAATQAVSLRLAAPLVQPHPVAGFPVGPGLCAGAAILGALLPDLDAEDSTILHELGGWGLLAKAGLGILGVKHRGLLHSGLAVVLVAFLAELIGGWLGYRDVGLALALGYASHVIIADAATIAGVPLLWPTPRRFHLLPRLLRVRTGGLVEKLIFVATLLALLWLLPDLLPPEFLKTLRQWLA